MKMSKEGSDELVGGVVVSLFFFSFPFLLWFKFQSTVWIIKKFILEHNLSNKSSTHLFVFGKENFLMNFFLVISGIKNQKKVTVVKDLQLLRERFIKADADHVVQNLMSCSKTLEVCIFVFFLQSHFIVELYLSLQTILNWFSILGD